MPQLPLQLGQKATATVQWHTVAGTPSNAPGTNSWSSSNPDVLSCVPASGGKADIQALQDQMGVQLIVTAPYKGTSVTQIVDIVITPLDVTGGDITLQYGPVVPLTEGGRLDRP